MTPGPQRRAESLQMLDRTRNARVFAQRLTVHEKSCVDVATQTSAPSAYLGRGLYLPNVVRGVQKSAGEGSRAFAVGGSRTLSHGGWAHPSNEDLPFQCSCATPSTSHSPSPLKWP